jgi:hypothetical protein
VSYYLVTTEREDVKPEQAAEEISKVLAVHFQTLVSTRVYHYTDWPYESWHPERVVTWYPYTKTGEPVGSEEDDQDV